MGSAECQRGLAVGSIRNLRADARAVLVHRFDNGHVHLGAIRAAYIFGVVQQRARQLQRARGLPCNAHSMRSFRQRLAAAN